jgi:hypothetical protein
MGPSVRVLRGNGPPAAHRAVTKVTSILLPGRSKCARRAPAARGAGMEEQSMISKCANPDCSATFDDRCGRFYRFHQPHAPHETPANHHSVWHFWLCQRCAEIYTLENGSTGVLISPRLSHSNVKAAPRRIAGAGMG